MNVIDPQNIFCLRTDSSLLCMKNGGRGLSQLADPVYTYYIFSSQAFLFMSHEVLSVGCFVRRTSDHAKWLTGTFQ